MTDEPHFEDPQEGYYRRKMVRNGPWVGVHIARHCVCRQHPRHVWNDDCDRYPHITALLQGTLLEDAEIQWTYCRSNEVTKEEYDHLIKLQDWAEEHAPDDPYAKTTLPIDHMKIKSIF